MGKVMDALGDMFTEDIFQLLLDRKYKEAKAMMKKFAYRMPKHKEVIQKTRKEKWYSEDMFTRFTIQQKIVK